MGRGIPYDTDIQALNLSNGSYQRSWQMDWAAFENNIIELVSSDAPFGMNFTGPAVAPFTFLEAVIRRNSIRNVDGIVNATGLPGGIQVSSCEGLIQEENIHNWKPE